MKIYTSNYWKYQGNRGVQISAGKPDNVKVNRSLPILYPSWDMVRRWNAVKKNPNDDPDKIREWNRYCKEYWNKLVKVGADRILSQLCDGDVLLCWCNTKYCHRFILAEWLRRQGVEVEEIW